MKCECGKWFDYYGEEPPDPVMCPSCIAAAYDSDMFRNRRIFRNRIYKRLREIEKELYDSKDPATLRLERSELDTELEILGVEE